MFKNSVLLDLMVSKFYRRKYSRVLGGKKVQKFYRRVEYSTCSDILGGNVCQFHKKNAYQVL
jgi:hypothetical protein